MPILEFLMQILVLGVHPSEMGCRPTGRRLLTWGVSSHPTIAGVPMQVQGASATSQPKICNSLLHFIIQITGLCLLCKSSFGLPSKNMPKGQPSNSTPPPSLKPKLVSEVGNHCSFCYFIFLLNN